MKPAAQLKLQLVTGLGLLVAAVVSMLAYTLVQSRAQKEEEIASNVKNYTRLLDQSISSSARKIDLSLLGIADQLQTQLKVSKQLSGDSTNAMLALRKEWHGGEVDFRVTDQEGWVRFGPGVQASNLASYADRPFFKQLRSSEGAQMVVSQPVLGKVSKIWVIVFARRYTKPDGSFGGVVAAAVPISNFNVLLRGLDLGPNGIAVLRDAEGALLTRYPESDEPAGKIGAKIFSKEFADILASGQESVAYHTYSSADNSERLVSYQRLQSVPFKLIVGVSPQDYLADWRSQARGTAIAGLAFVLVAMLFAWGLLRSFNASEKARADSDRALAERNAALNDLKSQWSLVSEIVESLPYGLVVYDDQRVKQLANSKFGHILKIPPEISEKPSFTFFEFLQHCDLRGDFSDGEPVDQRYARLAEAMQARRLLGGERKQADGAFIEFRAFPISNGWTAITYLDNTERRREQEALRETQTRVTIATESAGIGIWEYDLHSDELLWDAQQYRLYGMEPDGVTKTYDMWVEKLHPEDLVEAQALLKNAIDHRTDFVAEFRIVWSDSSTHYIRALGRLTMDADGNPIRVVGTNRDITDAVLAAKSLQEARKKAEQASVSKSLFLANMSHEIRTPMNAIMGLSQLLSNTPMKPNQMDYVGKITSSAKSLLGLLNDILDFSKIEADKLDLVAEPFDADRLLQDVAVVLAAYVANKPLDLVYDIDPNVPAVLMGDALRVRQILVNLAGNAIKFTEQGQVVLSLKLRTGTHASGGSALLEFAIQDSGIGIAPEVLPLLFNSFTQAEETTTRRFGGTGLGLAICKKLVELMGGTIGVTSEMGVGSRFVFQIELPVQTTLQNAQAASTTEPKTVLLVDDNASAREAAMNMMLALGWRVMAATACDEAMELIESSETGLAAIDAVFIDCQLHPVNGWDTAKRIAACKGPAAGANTRYVMMGVNGRDRLDQRTPEEQALVDCLIAKPFTANVLRNALSRPVTSRAKGADSPSGASRKLEGIRILVVEDNAINQQVAEELLTAQGAIVSIASDGRQGVNAIASAKTQYDIVMMDVQMPVMDGYEATRAIREKLGLEALPIVGLTANAMASDRDRCLQAGMNAHLAKPFELTQLVATIENLVRATTANALAPNDAVYSDESVPAFSAAPAVEERTSEMDIANALAKVGGMIPLYKRAALTFVSQLPDLQPALVRAIAESNVGQALSLLHTYKGTAATVGLTGLKDFLAKLESNLHQEPNLESLKDQLPRLKAFEQFVQSDFKRAVEQLSDDKAVPPPEENLTPAIQHLHALLVAEDYEALSYFAKSRDVLMQMPDVNFQRLETAIQALDFEEALAACQAT